MKRLIAFLLAAVMLLSLAACSGSAEPDTSSEPSQQPSQQDSQQPGGETDGPQYGGHLDVRVASTLVSLDPHKAVGTWRNIWTNMVFESFITRDADNNIVPGLCNFDLSEDYLTLKFWVRDNATFSDGSAVEIEDVVASLQRAFKLYGSLKKYVAPYVESLTVDGKEATLKLTEYHEKSWFYLASWQTWCAVLPQEICEKYPDDYITDQIEDAIGTGPYIVADFENNVSVTLKRRDGYTPSTENNTGMATPKMAYLDSITYWYNGDDSSAGLAALSGDHDLVEVIPADYMAMAEQQGLVKEVLPSNVGVAIYFNTVGTNNICAKYPALRKAIMAAIDYEEFAGVITDGASKLSGFPLLDERYKTDVFEQADYFGATNAEAAQKYLAEAKAQGYQGEPVQITYNNTRNDVPSLLAGYLSDAGIEYEVNLMEANAYAEFVGDANNNWDFQFMWPTLSYTPTQMPVGMIETYYKNPAKDALLSEMEKLPQDSAEYLEKWNQLAEMMVEDCASVMLGTIDWFWYHPDTFVSNDNGLNRFLFNSYWKDPENHQN